MEERVVHYLRNDVQTLCGRNASKVKNSPFLSDVNCRMCLNSFPVEITGSSNIIKTLQDNGYELDGIKPVFIKLIHDKLFIKRSRWMNWDKVEKYE